MSSSAGLCRFENGRWRQFNTADGLLHNNVTYLTEAPDHAVWVGRDPIGISRLEFDGDRLRAPAISAPRRACRQRELIFCASTAAAGFG